MMGWRDLMGYSENETLAQKPQKPQKPPRKIPFEDIEDIEDRSLKSTLGNYSTISHNKKREVSPLMGWRKRLDIENETLAQKPQKPQKPPRKIPFAYIVDIVDKTLKSTLGNYSTISHNKKREVSPLVEVYPDCRGWKLSDLEAWKRCLECEWAWWERGAHVCLDQDGKRVDRAITTCKINRKDDQR